MTHKIKKLLSKMHIIKKLKNDSLVSCRDKNTKNKRTIFLFATNRGKTEKDQATKHWKVKGPVPYIV